MFAFERKIRVPCVIELRTFPGLFAMAGLAFFPIATLVPIVTLVTAVAVLFRLFFRQSLRVTGFATDVAVLPTQPEFGIAIMIEVGLVPLL
jgi:hypothetical protein